MGFGTNDARGKTGAPVLMTSQARINVNKEAYRRGWGVLLNGGVMDNFIELQGGVMVRNLYDSPNWVWTPAGGAQLMTAAAPFGTVYTPAGSRPTRAINVFGFNQMPHAPNIFINKISWANPAAVTATSDPLDGNNVSNVNNYFSAYSEQIARSVGAHSINLYDRTLGQTQYYKDFVHLANATTLPAAQRGDIWLGNWIGTQVAAVQLPDLVPCGQVAGAFPVNTNKNVQISLANLGKVQSGSYKLGFNVTLPKGVSPVVTDGMTSVTNPATGVASLYRTVVPLVSTALATMNPPLVSDPNKFRCYVAEEPVSPLLTTNIRCDAIANSGSHAYGTPAIWADNAEQLISLTPPTLPNTPSVVPTSANSVSLSPGASYPYNQAFLDIPVRKAATGFVAAGNNAKIVVDYGGKEFARSNNTMTFTIP
jgi:hypothetical protein